MPGIRTTTRVLRPHSDATGTAAVPGLGRRGRRRAAALVQPEDRTVETAGWWNCANALTVVIHHSQRTGERRYRYVIETTFSRAQRVNPGFSNEYYDDDGWWALAWIAAFDLTGEMKYLDLARKLFAGMALAGMTCAAACGGRAKTLEERDTERAVLAHCRTPASAHDRFRQRRGHLSRLGAARVAVVSGQRADLPGRPGKRWADRRLCKQRRHGLDLQPGRDRPRPHRARRDHRR